MKDFEVGFIERSDHEAWFDFFRDEIVYDIGLSVGGLEIVTDVILGKRAFDAGVETVTKAGEEIFAELFIQDGGWVRWPDEEYEELVDG